jgi:hypothetical protein
MSYNIPHSETQQEHNHPEWTHKLSNLYLVEYAYLFLTIHRMFSTANIKSQQWTNRCNSTVPRIHTNVMSTPSVDIPSEHRLRTCPVEILASPTLLNRTLLLTAPWQNYMTCTNHKILHYLYPKLSTYFSPLWIQTVISVVCLSFAAQNDRHEN